jgi:integrase
MAKKLTAVSVENAKPKLGPGGKLERAEYFDGVVPAFSLIVQPSGKKSWAVRYRHKGRLTKYTIGPYPLFDLKTAREAASEALDAVAHGRDPAQEAKDRKQQTADTSCLFRTVVEDFIRDYAKPKNKSWLESARLLGLRLKKDKKDEWEVIPKSPVALWGECRIDAITKDDVNKVFKRLKAETPYAANRTFSALRKFFNWCVTDLRLSVSPLRDWKPDLAAEQNHDRVLSPEEIRWLWKGCEGQGLGVFGAAVKLLLLTGQRRDEVCKMTLGELSQDGALWTLSKERTKNKQTHLVPLSPLAQEVLAGVPRVESKAGWVFTTNGRSAIAGYSKMKARLNKEMATVAQGERGEDFTISPWRLHDLRRTVASHMARLGVNLPVIEKVLNHISGSFGGIVGVYQHHDFADEKRKALEAWAAEVSRIISGEPAKVVPMTAKWKRA